MKNEKTNCKIKTSFFTFFFCFLYVLTAFSCSSTPLPSGGQVNIPEDFLGIVHAAGTPNPIEEQLLKEMECKWVLSTFYWHRIETEIGVYNFNNYDVFVDYNKKQGRKIVGVLGYGSDFSNPKKKKIFRITKDSMPLFLRFVEETVRRYKGKVDVWSIWNEPNITFWSGTDKEFYEMTKLAAEKIRETDPDAYIIGGVFWRSPSGFIKKMQKAGSFTNLDALAFHPYAVNPSDCMNVYDKFKKILSGFNYSGPIWITEMGYPTGGWYPSKVFLNKYPSFIVKTITGAAARGARALLWYEMEDAIEKGKSSLDSEDHFGLTHKNFERKAGSWAFELCARYLPGSRYVPDLPQRDNIPSNIISFCFMNGISGNNTLVLWNDKKSGLKIEIILGTSALLHDISTGQNTQLTVNTSVNITDKPIIITWQGENLPRIEKK